MLGAALDTWRSQGDKKRRGVTVVPSHLAFLTDRTGRANQATGPFKPPPLPPLPGWRPHPAGPRRRPPGQRLRRPGPWRLRRRLGDFQLHNAGHCIANTGRSQVFAAVRGALHPRGAGPSGSRSRHAARVATVPPSARKNGQGVETPDSRPRPGGAAPRSSPRRSGPDGR